MLKIKTWSNTDLTHWPVTRLDPVKIADPVTRDPVPSLAEGFLKWDGKNGFWGLCPQWGPGQNPRWRVWRRSPHKMTTLMKNKQFCHRFENSDIFTIYCLQMFHMKWTRNKFGGGRKVCPLPMFAHWAQKVDGRLLALPIGSASSGIYWFDCVLTGRLLFVSHQSNWRNENKTIPFNAGNTNTEPYLK